MKRLPAGNLSPTEYYELADFRYQIRRFLHFSEGAALKEGIEPRQHQALLAIKAMQEQETCTIGVLAERLLLRHQSTVGLIDRLERHGLVARVRGDEDGRQVIVAVTREGEQVLKRLSLTHRTELKERAPEFARALRAIMRRTKSAKQNENG
jgi:DNA-binding MarR family transcriptional regulator